MNPFFYDIGYKRLVMFKFSQKHNGYKHFDILALMIRSCKAETFELAMLMKDRLDHVVGSAMAVGLAAAVMVVDLQGRTTFKEVLEDLSMKPMRAMATLFSMLTASLVAKWKTYLPLILGLSPF